MATPNLALFPSGRKATKLYSVLPTDGTGDFTVSRASKKNEINSDLKLEIIENNVPAFNYDAIGGCPVLNTEPQATNLITYPISFGNSYWTKSGATIEGDATTAGSEMLTNGDFSNPASWTASTSEWVVAGSNATATGNSTNSWLTQTITSVPANTFIKVTYTVVSNSLVGGTGLIAIGAYGGADIFSNNPLLANSNVVGTHSEYFMSAATARTNVALYLNATMTSGAVVLSDISFQEVQGYSAPSVDFPTSAFKLVEDTSTGAHRVDSIEWIFITGGTTVTQSVYVKANGRSIIGLQDDALGAGHAVFNLSTATILEINGVSAKIETLADGWFRVSYTFVSGGVGSQPYKTGIYALDTYTTGPPLSNTYTGDGTSGLYLFMAQLEQGSVATSPTFTDITLAAEGSTTTRLVDSIINTGVSSVLGQAEGVIYFEGSYTDTSDAGYIEISDGTSNNRIIIWNLTATLLRGLVVVGGAVQAQISGGIISSNTTFKAAFKYKVNDFALWVNGVKIGTDVAGLTYGSGVLNKINLSVGTVEFNGNIKAIQVYDTALSDAELAILTTL